jgi:hypothetical protein
VTSEQAQANPATPGHLDASLDAPDAVEAALAAALSRAAAAGRFDVVAQLAKELEARRLARMGNVHALEARRDRLGS